MCVLVSFGELKSRLRFESRHKTRNWTYLREVWELFFCSASHLCCTFLPHSITDIEQAFQRNRVKGFAIGLNNIVVHLLCPLCHSLSTNVGSEEGDVDPRWGRLWASVLEGVQYLD